MGMARFTAVSVLVAGIMGIIAVFGCSPSAVYEKDMLMIIGKASGIFGCRGAKLNLTGVNIQYKSPYLLDFSFSLRDGNNHAVIADPSSFTIIAEEDSDPISTSETAFLLAGAENKEMKCFMVLDYTNSMADTVQNGDSNGNGKSDAIETMETAAKTFIDTLNEDAQVGVYEFHREDYDPAERGLVQHFTTDKNHLKTRIGAIWTEYVQGFPASTRCWDAVYAAVRQFEDRNQEDEQRFIVFLSDGRDESSTRSTSDIISVAQNRDVHIYCIGFGAELNSGPLQQITEETGGQYYTAQSVESLTAQFVQIAHDLGGQYTLRWATLKKTGSFTPSFEIILEGKTGSYEASRYDVDEYEGDILKGLLRIPEFSISGGSATAYLRAEYVPRYVRKFSFYVKSPYSFSVQYVAASSGGLCSGWQQPQKVQAEDGVGWDITLSSSNPDDNRTSITYGAFGPILRFEFSGLPENPEALFQQISVDNTIYESTGGQKFVLEYEGQVQQPAEGEQPEGETPIEGEIEPGDETTILLPGDVPLVMVDIPAGTFMMGRYSGEQDSVSDEDPQHSVTLSQDFYMGKYEVTQEQWLAVMGSWPGTSPSSSYGVGDDYPAYYVSWNDAQNFIKALNTHITNTSQGAATFRLPTEAEREYACRAGTTTRFYWGDDPGYTMIDDYAWHTGNSGSKSHEVGGKLPNAFGLYDMSGNLYEWCQDWYGDYPSGSVTDPTGPTSAYDRVLRGGSWNYILVRYCRSANRYNKTPDDRSYDSGFRVVRTQ